MGKFKDPRTGVTVEFDPKTHRYFIDGEHMLSVTTIIRMTSGRGNSTGDMPPKFKEMFEKAGNFGTLVHDATDLMDRKKAAAAVKLIKNHPIVEERKKAQLDVEAWKRFLKDEGYKVENSEHRVYSVKHRFAGTLDNTLIKIGKDDVARRIKVGHRILADKKTGLLKPEATLQLSAYSGAWDEMTGEEIQGRMVVQLNQGATKRGYRLHYFPGWRIDWRVFICKCASHRWDMANGVY